MEQPRIDALIYLVFNINPQNLPPVVEVEENLADPFSVDPHITWAICCIGLSVILMLIVCATAAVDRRQTEKGPDR